MKKLTALAAAVVFASAICAQPAQQWSQGDPSPQAQEAMEWLNAARHDPVGTLGTILNLAGSDSVVAGFMLAESPVTASQLQAQLSAACQTAQVNGTLFPSSSAISNAPLVFYPLFQGQAESWGAQAMPPATNFPAQRPPPAYIYPVPFFVGNLLNGPSNVLAGPNATGGTAQFGPYGANYTEVSQANLYASYISGREWVLTMLATPGSGSPPPSFLAQGDSLPGDPIGPLGHTRMVGLAFTPGTIGNQILTLYKGSQEFFTQSDLPYGDANTVFVTGVAYRDNNSNGRFDAGEGVPRVTITLDHGGWYAVTASAGGYAIPVLANSGTYTLTANGGPFNGATATVVVGSDSVKCDWVLPALTAALPPQVTVDESDGDTQLVGLSTRGLVEAGNSVLIGGFVIGGPTGNQKQVLIRGVGPSLQTAGVPANECIPATQVQLFDGNGEAIASNNGWTTAPDGGISVIQASAEVGDFPLTNWAGGGGDSALVATLSPGAYTVVVSPSPGLPEAYLTGRVGLVEVYDVSKTEGGKFVDISTRALVGSDYAQLIAGCTVAGNGHKRLLVRGVGPGLSAFGVSGFLPNPSLTLFDASSNSIASNAGWSNSAQTTQIGELNQTSGAFALSQGSSDSALLAVVPPGNYTASVGGQPGTSPNGIALVEIYETP
jgi:hypothetical protein